MAAKRIIDHGPREERNLNRLRSVRTVKQTFLIVCEGVNTEPDYFNAFRLTSAAVRAVGEGINTVGLVRKAIKIKEQEKDMGHRFDQQWVVFDKDDFPDNDFNNAIVLAERNGFEVAYSNQAFEYWFLLHFYLYRGAIHRSQYESRLSSLLGFPYSKKAGVSGRMFNALLSRQQQAISFAKTIQKSFDGRNPAREESSTTVYKLVEELNLYV